MLDIKKLFTKILQKLKAHDTSISAVDTKANRLPNWFNPNGSGSGNRPANANITPDSMASVKHFLATGSMTANKPKSDGNILHFSWDNGDLYASQLAILHNADVATLTPWIFGRYQTGANAYTIWRGLKPCACKGQTINLNEDLYCGGFITSGAALLCFNIPIPVDPSATVTCRQLLISVRTAAGGYGYMRYGSGGGSYLALSGPTQIWNNGAQSQSNSISSMSAVATEAGIQIKVTFAYGLAKASGNTATIANNSAVGLDIKGQFAFS